MRLGAFSLSLSLSLSLTRRRAFLLLLLLPSKKETWFGIVAAEAAPALLNLSSTDSSSHRVAFKQRGDLFRETGAPLKSSFQHFQKSALLLKLLASSETTLDVFWSKVERVFRPICRDRKPPKVV